MPDENLYEPPEVERRRGYPPASKQEVAEMRQSQEALDRSVRGLHSQLRSLDATLRDFVPRRELAEHFPTKRDLEEEHQEAAVRRRHVAEGLLLVVILVIQAHDTHIEQCRPIQQGGLVGRPSGDFATLVCDATFPTHNHSSGQGAHDALSAGNLIGGVLYLTLIVALLLDLSKRAKRARKEK